MPHSTGFGRRRDRRPERPLALGDVAAMPKACRGVVGERLAEATAPVSLEGGCLVVRAADGPWGSQATYLAEEIRKRADEALGGGAVTTIRIVVGTHEHR